MVGNVLGQFINDAPLRAALEGRRDTYRDLNYRDTIRNILHELNNMVEINAQDWLDNNIRDIENYRNGEVIEFLHNEGGDHLGGNLVIENFPNLRRINQHYFINNSL